MKALVRPVIVSNVLSANKMNNSTGSLNISPEKCIPKPKETPIVTKETVVEPKVVEPAVTQSHQSLRFIAYNQNGPF